MASQHKPLETLSYQKSNELVSAKYKSSLLENKLVAIALTRIEANAKDENAPLKARLYPGELKRLVGDPTHVYSRLKKVSKNMTGHSIVLEDGLGNFKAFAIVTNANYVDGILEITLNDELRRHILGLEGRFTSLDLSVMSSFTKGSSFRLYEVFKSHIYKSNSKINNGCVQIEYGIAELKFTIGLANADDESIRNLRAKMGNVIDWDLLYDKLDDRAKVYKQWSEFERNVIRPAQEELNYTSDIRFEYAPIRDGRKMARIKFDIYPNTPASVVNEKQLYLEEKMRNNHQSKMPRDIPQFEHVYLSYTGHNGLTAEDLDLFIIKARFDANLVVNSICLADEQPEVHNYVGWILKCIDAGGYTAPIGTVHGSAEKHEAFKEIQSGYNANKELAAAKLWESMKSFDQFTEFMSYMNECGIESIEMLEAAYTPQELVKMFTDYKSGKNRH